MLSAGGGGVCFAPDLECWRWGWLLWWCSAGTRPAGPRGSLSAAPLEEKKTVEVSAVKKIMKVIDINQDGKLSRAEFDRMAPLLVQAHVSWHILACRVTPLVWFGFSTPM